MCDGFDKPCFHRSDQRAAHATSMLRHSGWMAAVMAVGFGLSGCSEPGPKLWPVSGKVTFQNQPVSGGIVRFCNSQLGIDMTADIHTDGGYEVIMAQGRGLPAGAYQVAIMPPRIDPPIGIVEQPAQHVECLNIPPKYRQPATSGLMLTVTSGNNTADFDLAAD